MDHSAENLEEKNAKRNMNSGGSAHKVSGEREQGLPGTSLGIICMMIC